MTTLLKRKMGPSENIFMSHALDSVTEAAVSGPKKSMKLEQPVRGRGQGAEQLGRGDVRNKVLGVLRTLMQHIFALPFVKIQTNSNVVVEDNNIAIGHNRMFLDDVCENIQNGSYEDIQDVMNGINKVFDQTVKSDGNLDFLIADGNNTNSIFFIQRRYRYLFLHCAG